MRTTDDGWLRPLGSTGLTTSAIVAGGGPIGGQPEIFGYDVPAARAIPLVEALLASPINVIDTSNGYTDGESERRIGAGIANVGGLPDGHWIATKVDPKSGDFSGERVRASVAESRERLGLDHLPLVHLHDPEGWPFEELTGPGGAVEALVDLKRDGAVGSIGVAGGHTPTLERYLDFGVVDVLLTHNRFTLVDRGADDLIARAHEAGVAVANAAVLGGGFLTEPATQQKYGYGPVTDETRRSAIAMQQVCAEHGVELSAAAMLFSLRDPRIAMTVVGFSRPERIPAILQAVADDLPDEFWERVDALVPPRSVFLDA